MTFSVAVRANEVWDMDDSYYESSFVQELNRKFSAKTKNLHRCCSEKIRRKGLRPIFGGIQGTENSSRT